MEPWRTFLSSLDRQRLKRLILIKQLLLIVVIENKFSYYKKLSIIIYNKLFILIYINNLTNIYSC
ncbi:MAG: hypothetical protein QXH44_08555, partial [Pyrobaculum sp.]